MPRHSPFRIELTREERRELESLGATVYVTISRRHPRQAGLARRRGVVQ